MDDLQQLERALLSPPGDTIRETLDEFGMSPAELAERGLSSKEIADYNIEPQGVHTKRDRLRKKSDLDSDESFDEFLNKRPADSRLQ